MVEVAGSGTSLEVAACRPLDGAIAGGALEQGRIQHGSGELRPPTQKLEEGEKRKWEKEQVQESPLDLILCPPLLA